METSVAEVTVRLADALRLPYCAVMVELPTATPLADPEESTVATLRVLELQSEELVTFCVLPSESDAVTENCPLVPLAMLRVAGATLRLATVALVTTTVAEDEKP
jgi:hypothetical protein